MNQLKFRDIIYFIIFFIVNVVIHELLHCVLADYFSNCDCYGIGFYPYPHTTIACPNNFGYFLVKLIPNLFNFGMILMGFIWKKMRFGSICFEILMMGDIYLSTITGIGDFRYIIEYINFDIISFIIIGFPVFFLNTIIGCYYILKKIG